MHNRCAIVAGLVAFWAWKNVILQQPFHIYLANRYGPTPAKASAGISRAMSYLCAAKIKRLSRQTFEILHPLLLQLHATVLLSSLFYCLVKLLLLTNFCR